MNHDPYLMHLIKVQTEKIKSLEAMLRELWGIVFNIIEEDGQVPKSGRKRQNG